MKEFLSILLGALVLGASDGFPVNNFEETNHPVQIQNDEIPCNEVEEPVKHLPEEDQQSGIESIIQKATILISPHDLKAVESTNSNNNMERYQHPAVFDTESLHKDSSETIKDNQSRKVRDVSQDPLLAIHSNSVRFQIRKEENIGRARDMASTKLIAPVFIKSSPLQKKNIPNIALLNQQLRNRIRPNRKNRK